MTDDIMDHQVAGLAVIILGRVSGISLTITRLATYYQNINTPWNTRRNKILPSSVPTKTQTH